jgi:hypothetical protein
LGYKSYRIDLSNARAGLKIEEKVKSWEGRVFMPNSVSLTVNGQAATVTVDDPGQPLLYQATALLAKTKNPSVAEIKKALTDNLCRCGTHLRIIRAVQRAAQNL